MVSGSGCDNLDGGPELIPRCLFGSASLITGPFAAGEGVSLVERGLMRLHGSGLTVDYGVSRSALTASPTNTTIAVGNAAASYPDRVWLEGLLALPGDCHLNATGRDCSWDVTGQGAPTLMVKGDVPVYIVRVQCVQAVHFTKLYFGAEAAPPAQEESSKAAPSFQTPSFPTPTTLLAEALPSGNIDFRGPLAAVRPLLGSEPALNEMVPPLKQKDLAVA